MKRSILRHKSALWLIAALTLASCSQDDPMGDNGTSLLEGVYPLEIATVTLDVMGSAQPWGADVPQTRVSENEDGSRSEWQDGDKIKVRIGNGTPGTYTYQSGGLTVAKDDTPAYWTSNAKEQNITAWYTSSGYETVDLSNQTNTLAYVLTAQATADFNKPVSLAFSHALAKVRVVLEGEKADEVKDVRIKTHTSCTLNTDGKLSADGEEDYIPMMVKTTYEGKTYWEANVVPGYPIADIRLNGDTPCTLEGTVKPVGRKLHVVTITVNKAPTEITGGEITEPGDYIIKNATLTETVTLNADGINLTLQNARIAITNKNQPAISITGGSATFIVEGTDNMLSSSQWGGIVMSNNASLTIQGNGKDKSSLTVQAGENGADWASCVGIGAGVKSTCGNITISDVSLTVSGANAARGCAAIGTSCENPDTGTTSTCGNITISNSKIDATGGDGAAAIGTGSMAYIGNGNSLACGDIRVTNSEIKATVNPYTPSIAEYGAGIGTGLAKIESSSSSLSVTCGKIILDISEDKLEEFTSGWVKNGAGSGSQYKIGKGPGDKTTFGGLYLNGQVQTPYSADGWGTW